MRPPTSSTRSPDTTLFRSVEAFLDADAIRSVTIDGRRELAPVAEQGYVAFVDPSGGSRDSFTLAIAHAEESAAVLDAVREVRPPFSPGEIGRAHV